MALRPMRSSKVEGGSIKGREKVEVDGERLIK